MTEDTYDYVIIDADSIIYQIAYVEENLTKACIKFDESIEKIVKNTGARNAHVYIKGDGNFRMSYEPTYKQNRKDNIEPAVKERIKLLYEHAKGYCFESDGAEADDYVCAAMKTLSDKGYTAIVAHIDKDLNCIPGWHYNFRTEKATILFPSEAYLFCMLQMITGDSTDNIQGIRGLGPVKAGKQLEGVNLADMLSKVHSVWKHTHGDGWEDKFTVCANLIYMRDSLDDLRPLTFEELKDRLTWKPTIQATGLLSQIDQPEPSDSSTLSSDQPEDSTSEESS